MMHDTEVPGFELIHIIVNFGSGSKILQSAKQYGISGGTVLLGKGTVSNRILEFLGLTDERKELILMVAAQATAYEALDRLDAEFRFDKPNHGIAFTTSVCTVAGTRNCACSRLKNEGSEQNTMYQAITIIVERGKAEEAIDAAAAAGSKGGTIIHARGSGIHETSKVFSMDIEPEKEIAIILSKTEKTEAIIASIREKLKIDEPGNGIIYVQNVSKTYGLYE